ncbi:hypothetical protein Hdeb2414_s0136g00808651 [Helianthus debilis subsp. tardiflorus]
MLTSRQGCKTAVVDNQISAFRGLHGKAVVARMIDLEALKSIYVIMNDICPGVGKVQYLGGLSVLLSFEDNAMAIKFIEDAREVIGRFSSLDLWEGQSFGFDRLAWIKIVGIPLHLINSEVFDVVGSVFGKSVHRAGRSDNDDDLSHDYIGVLVGNGKRISEEIKLVWRDRRFSVWVSEESGVWVPEFYKAPSPVTADDNVEATLENTCNIGMVDPVAVVEPVILETPIGNYDKNGENNAAFNEKVVLETID